MYVIDEEHGERTRVLRYTTCSGIKKLYCNRLETERKIVKKCCTTSRQCTSWQEPRWSAALHNAGFDVLNRSYYSPSLAPSDCYLFPKDIRRKKLTNDEKVKDAVPAWFSDTSSKFFYFRLLISMPRIEKRPLGHSMFLNNFLGEERCFQNWFKDAQKECQLIKINKKE